MLKDKTAKYTLTINNNEDGFVETGNIWMSGWQELDDNTYLIMLKSNNFGELNLTLTYKQVNKLCAVLNIKDKDLI